MAGLMMAGAAWAQGPGSGPGGPGGRGFDGHRPPMERAFGGHGVEGRWWNNPRMIEQLKLTDEQRKDFDQILLDHREKLIDLHGNLEKAELVMEPLMHADQPDEGKILAQIDKVAAARAELEKANARYLLALRAKLTPEQWKTMQELRENRGRMHEGWDGRGPGGHEHGRGRGTDGPNGAPPPPGHDGSSGPTGQLNDESAPQPPVAAPEPGGRLR
jgi:Spy/CpxP family protein refolding chaperone